MLIRCSDYPNVTVFVHCFSVHNSLLCSNITGIDGELYHAIKSLHQVPFVEISNVIARFRRIPKSLIEASMDLGAEGWQTFIMYCCSIWHQYGLLEGYWLIALSFDEIIVTTFTTGHQQTLPLGLLSQLNRPYDVPVTNVVVLCV